MKTRLIVALAGLACAGAASAQASKPMDQTPLLAQKTHRTQVERVRMDVDGVPLPPLPPACMDHQRPDIRGDGAEARWQGALGITAAQARQVQQVFEQRQKDDKATCGKLRGIVGDKAMDRWTARSDFPPPPPPPDAPQPPQPPQMDAPPPPLPPTPPVPPDNEG